jgi:hypothetical protein
VKDKWLFLSPPPTIPQRKLIIVLQEERSVFLPPSPSFSLFSLLLPPSPSFILPLTGSSSLFFRRKDSKRKKKKLRTSTISPPSPFPSETPYHSPYSDLPGGEQILHRKSEERVMLTGTRTRDLGIGER